MNIPKKENPKTKQQRLFLYQRQNQLLFFTYDLNHPKRIDLEEFRIGQFRLYRQERIFIGTLLNKPHLNPLLIWNAESFELMIKKLSQFTITEEVIDMSEEITLSVWMKVRGKEIFLLKIRLYEEFGLSVSNELWTDFSKYNLSKSCQYATLNSQIAKIDQKILQSQAKVNQVKQQQTQKIDQLKRKLSALLYEKQKKLMDVSNNKALFTYRLQQENHEKKINSGSTGWISSQEDRTFVGSLFASQQDYEI